MKIVLVEPQIPQNTGNIARLTAAMATELHLVEPLGFELSDRYLKRAGLDYWPHVNLSIHKCWDDFLSHSSTTPDRLWFFSTKGRKSYLDVSYSPESYIVFGSETQGLAQSFHNNYSERILNIPMVNAGVRSLNLANSVAIALMEARRQNRQ